ncbi:MAG: hypothetical protein RR835_13435 [Peptostreptococcaceae bacterium]
MKNLKCISSSLAISLLLANMPMLNASAQDIYSDNISNPIINEKLILEEEKVNFNIETYAISDITEGISATELFETRTFAGLTTKSQYGYRKYRGQATGNYYYEFKVQGYWKPETVKYSTVNETEIKQFITNVQSVNTNLNSTIAANGATLAGSILTTVFTAGLSTPAAIVAGTAATVATAQYYANVYNMSQSCYNLYREIIYVS